MRVPNPLRKQAPSRVWNIAHRGARAFAPENTLCAFEKAKKFGCPMFEIDVHRTKDGILIVHHDDQLSRCTDVAIRYRNRKSYFISDFTYARICHLDAGTWYVREIERPAAQRQPFLQTLTAAELRAHVSLADRAYYQSGVVRIPTLRETLELADGFDMMVNIELKTLPRMYPQLASDVVAMVKQLGFVERVLISSFDHEQLLIVRQLSPKIATAVLTSDRLARPADYLQMLDADAYNPGCYGDYDSLGFGSEMGILDPCGIHQVRAANRGVNAWTCNDKAQMRQLIVAGATGLISDYPNRVHDVLAEA